MTCIIALSPKLPTMDLVPKHWSLRAHPLDQYFPRQLLSGFTGNGGGSSAQSPGSATSLDGMVIPRAVVHFALGVCSLAVYFSLNLGCDSSDLRISLNPQLKVSILVPLASLGCLSWIFYLQPCRLCVPYFQYDRSTCSDFSN